MQIAIIGAGTMGTGIAQAAALGADSVLLHDSDETILRVALANISRGLDRGVRRHQLARSRVRRARRVFALTTDLARCASADLVIEAIPDVLPAKQALLRRLDSVLDPSAIVATTTGTLPLTRLAAASQHPQRVIGLHFFPPAQVMRLVEVVRTPQTLPSLLDRTMDLLRAMDKTPIAVDDSPGWVVNRIAQAYFGEAFSLLDAGGLTIETIDRLMEAAGFPMGPFRLMDFVGVDKTFQITQQIYHDTFAAAPYRPHARQHRLVEAGRLGRNSPQGGFYPPGRAVQKES